MPLGDVAVEPADPGIWSVGPRPQVLLPTITASPRSPVWLTMEIEAPDATTVRLRLAEDEDLHPGQGGLARALPRGWSALGFVVTPLAASRMRLELGPARGRYKLDNLVLRNIAAGESDTMVSRAEGLPVGGQCCGETR